MKKNIFIALGICFWMCLFSLHFFMSKDSIYNASAEQSEKPTFQSNSASSSIILRVMTINLRHNLDFWEERFPLIADEIVRLKPDLIGFQETHIGTNQSKILRKLIKERAEGMPMEYNVYEHLKTGGYALSGEGISIFSKYPIETKKFIDLGNGRLVLFTRIKVTDTLTVDFYNTHLHHMGGDEIRLPQAIKIVDFIKQNDNGYITFLTGDMNAIPDSATIKYFTESGLIDTYKEFHKNEKSEKGWGTSPIILQKKKIPQNPVNRIDYVFYKPSSNFGPNVKILDSIICFKNANEEGLYPSDHLGVMTTFEINN